VLDPDASEASIVLQTRPCRARHHKRGSYIALTGAKRHDRFRISVTSPKQPANSDP
jgi:hypothetical protein